MILRIATIMFFGFGAIVALAQPASNQVSNADIAKMLKAGVDQKIVKWVIENSDGKNLDASPTAIQALKAAGASRSLLDAVSSKSKKAHLRNTIKGDGQEKCAPLEKFAIYSIEPPRITLSSVDKPNMLAG